MGFYEKVFIKILWSFSDKKNSYNGIQVDLNKWLAKSLEGEAKFDI